MFVILLIIIADYVNARCVHKLFEWGTLSFQLFSLKFNAVIVYLFNYLKDHSVIYDRQLIKL